MMYAHGGFGLGFLNFLGTLLFFVALFWAFRFFMRGRCSWRRSNGSGTRWERGEDEAASKARERFAKGEIGEDEFSRLRDSLKRTVRGERSPLEWFGGDRALELARMRLAKGELSLEEFETLRKALQS